MPRGDLYIVTANGQRSMLWGGLAAGNRALKGLAEPKEPAPGELSCQERLSFGSAYSPRWVYPLDRGIQTSAMSETAISVFSSPIRTGSTSCAISLARASISARSSAS